MSGEIATELNKQGVKVTPNYVSSVKTKLKKTHKTKTAKQPAVIETFRAGGCIDAESWHHQRGAGQKVSQLMKTLGGFPRVVEVLDVVRELGGVKKFKELAAAISGTEPNDMPF